MAITDISEEMHMLLGVKALTSVYEKVSLHKIASLKEEVLLARNFTEKIITTFSLIQQKTTGMVKKKKEASVLLSANSFLYGDIILAVFRKFSEETKQTNADIIIIGEVGRQFFEHASSQKHYTFLPFPDENYTQKEIQEILTIFMEYEKVLLYYGKFESAFSQVPAVLDLSSGIADSTIDAKETYLFEPEASLIHATCEENVLHGLSRQVLHEIELAKSASRMKAMEKTHDAVASRLKKLITEKMRLLTMSSDIKQREQLAKIQYIQKKRSTYA